MKYIKGLRHIDTITHAQQGNKMADEANYYQSVII